ncbi:MULTISPECIES: hypothetical protein [Frankia]|uniref:CHRD domain-containing protein n=1 Tax=Frankia alni (strain DSM 45986 / CECT 9034 / ACN14a) TaxID=326424 RepID=Q0RHT7_FRAAA|nr:MULTISPECIES: hypothetical protein [Frankia]CAJ62936.1 hypothetical protein; putative signal peptide [Frankia alni ACN14a]
MRRGLRGIVPGIGVGLLPLAVLPILAVSGPDGSASAVLAPPADHPFVPPADAASTPPGRGDTPGDEPTYLIADLGPVNRSGASGTATATLRGNLLSIRIATHGLAPGLPHPQHIHIGGSHSCPGPDATGTGAGGQVRSGDAKKLIGAIAVSLTTTGDTGPDSSYALDRFPVGDAGYQRTITVSPRVAAQLRRGEGVIEQHGVDANHSGRYDGAARSDVKPELPEEVSNSAACGRLVTSPTAVPVGGVAAGGGGTA